MSASDITPGVPCRLLGALLHYPADEVSEALSEIEHTLLGAARIDGAARRDLTGFFAYWRERDLLTLQENYVAQFDRGRATSLYLFEHVYGESRDRGQAMVDLMQTYERSGIYLAPGELPDYLPAFLEYVSVLPASEAAVRLKDIEHLLQAIDAGLARQGSPYAAITRALLCLAGASMQRETQASPAHVDDAALIPQAKDYEAIDASYQDAPVRFMGAGHPGTQGNTVGEPIQFYARRPGR
ncbi:Nitrate reductase molybdenum cofactor assembly chaperone NarJ [Pandoraea morbifera]|uniref:Nitrate reductase molybdenum cofactor assembly chaperone NarJ n=1 Tax=Pandoraea morbifera TaxID=2508300 RepID=A0A5E4RQL7_9BURK|nr:nitrate reductase molybdenum cofactor assembly chaperone [Pandoraea morbifera]VVD64349.1 Nitrate reductase molybdenum cofactor assembly chaperone NarJ [Pandoraea morbifera]